MQPLEPHLKDMQCLRKGQLLDLTKSPAELSLTSIEPLLAIHVEGMKPMSKFKDGPPRYFRRFDVDPDEDDDWHIGGE